MSALRQRLKRPGIWLTMAAVVFVLAAADAAREPASQTTSRIYTVVVELYQRHGRGLSSKLFRCRYRPTCSEYSLLAVSRHGIVSGLRMTLERLASCRSNVPMGTEDPVPNVTR